MIEKKEINLLWVDSERPEKIVDVILPDRMKNIFTSIVENKQLPHLLLSGGAGMGKTTVALALCNELKCSTMVINASIERSIDTIRTKITRFVSEGSIDDQSPYKVVILDESDQLTIDAQKALRGFIEKYQQDVRFIFTCNYKNKLIEALWSRCKQIDFEFKGDERKVLVKSFYIVVCGILEKNNIEYDKNVVAKLITAKFPDFRSILNEVNTYAINGKIDVGILQNFKSVGTSEIIKILKDKDFTKMRKWVDENCNNGTESIHSELWKLADDYLTPDSLPSLVCELNEYQRYCDLVSDRNIALSSCLTMIMLKCKFK